VPWIIIKADKIKETVWEEIKSIKVDIDG